MQSTQLKRFSLNAAQAATYLDVSVGHLYNLIASGRGPRYVKYAGQLRFSPVDLEDWVATRCRTVDVTAPSRE
jgi:hypothetical protein